LADRRYTLRLHKADLKTDLPLDTELNDDQRRAVETDAERVLILAGAGSGKTRTLTYRVARLLEKGAVPEGIILATFTNRAAREMISRIEALLGGTARRVRAGTFHALAFASLRSMGARLGYRSGFGILDREDSSQVMAAAIADAGVDVSFRRFPSSDLLVNVLSLAINSDQTIERILLRRYPQFVPVEEQIARVLSHYARRKLDMNVMDFDDLLINWKSVLISKDSIAHQLASEVHHVLVDEFQDTNKIQADIAELLAAECRSLSVVGDDAQSIYSFRGARFDNILDFPRRAPTEVHRLVTNYRSVPEVLRLANEIIKNNPLQFPKELVAVRRAGVLPALVPACDTIQQAEFIAQRALELRDEGIKLADQAVLYRAHSQSIELQLELTKRDVPFVLRSGVRFFEQAHVKDVLAHLRVIANPADEISWRRVLGTAPGIGTKSAARIVDAVRSAIASGRDPLEAIAADEVVRSLPSRAAPSFLTLTESLRSLKARSETCRPSELIQALLAPTSHEESTPSPLLEHLSSSYPNAKERIGELLQLAEIAAEHDDLAEFLGEVTLVSELIGEDIGTTSDDREFLTLSTVHQAKGLEWRCVFVAGLSDGGFPHATALDEQDGEAEERRLFYVAVTRAMEQLYLCYPGSRFVREGERVLQRPSRFISELALTEGLLERWRLDGK
jgi:DNA helicase-2/ATP-dependent DNA helicase PcrA